MKRLHRELTEAGVVYKYATGQVAALFGKTRQWVQWGITNGVFVDAEGIPIEPEMTASGYLYTGDQVREIAVSCYNRKTLSMEELTRIFKRVIRDTGHVNGRYPTKEPE